MLTLSFCRGAQSYHLRVQQGPRGAKSLGPATPRKLNCPKGKALVNHATLSSGVGCLVSRSKFEAVDVESPFGRTQILWNATQPSASVFSSGAWPTHVTGFPLGRVLGTLDSTGKAHSMCEDMAVFSGFQTAMAGQCAVLQKIWGPFWVRILTRPVAIGSI